eukprot:1192958-Prorocentrum_minimum.AAC.3
MQDCYSNWLLSSTKRVQSAKLEDRQKCNFELGFSSTSIVGHMRHTIVCDRGPYPRCEGGRRPRLRPGARAPGYPRDAKELFFGLNENLGSKHESMAFVERTVVSLWRAAPFALRWSGLRANLDVLGARAPFAVSPLERASRGGGLMFSCLGSSGRQCTALNSQVRMIRCQMPQVRFGSRAGRPDFVSPQSSNTKIILATAGPAKFSDWDPFSLQFH